MPVVRVAGVQMQVSPDLSENLPTILAHVAQIDAEYVLFPEMSLTGYHGNFSDAALEEAFRAIADACRTHERTALIGTGFRDESATYIQTRIFGPTGALVGTYEKQIPTIVDRPVFTPGTRLPVFSADGWSYGCLICNDMCVTPGWGPYSDPRLSYQLGQLGVHLIFHSVNSGGDQRYRAFHESNLSLRAMESKVYIVTVNAACEAGPVNSGSGVMGPDGEWLIQCPYSGEHVFEYDIDLDVDR